MPGIEDIEHNQPKLRFRHRFVITLPREYPQNLGQVKIVNKTPLYHPRITGINNKACYTVNGELDRILVDIIFNILMRPETVRPPSEYKDADWGLNSTRMKWYISYGPKRVYEYLLKEWRQKQGGGATKKKSKIQILD